MLITVKYGVGYGSHDLDLDVPDDYTDEQIEEEASDAARERFWWSWERAEETGV